MSIHVLIYCHEYPVNKLRHNRISKTLYHFVSVCAEAVAGNNVLGRAVGGKCDGEKQNEFKFSHVLLVLVKII